MKKPGLLIYLLTIVVLGFSQEKKVRLGIQGGINIANINSRITYSFNRTSYTNKLPFQSIVGITGGVHAEVRLGHHFYLQPELSYSQLGAKASSSIADTTSPSRRSSLKGVLHYGVLPLLVKYKIPAIGAGIFAGPQYGYLLGTTNSINGTTLNDKDNSNYKSDFAAIFGAEYYSPIGLGISARYQLGLSNIQKPEYVDRSIFPQGVTPQSISVRNNAFTITVGYRF